MYSVYIVSIGGRGNGGNTNKRIKCHGKLYLLCWIAWIKRSTVLIPVSSPLDDSDHNQGGTLGVTFPLGSPSEVELSFPISFSSWLTPVVSPRTNAGGDYLKYPVIITSSSITKSKMTVKYYSAEANMIGAQWIAIGA